MDDAGVVQMMNQIAQQKSVNLNVLIEINIGMNRAGITQIKDLLNLCQLIDELITSTSSDSWPGRGMLQGWKIPLSKEAIEASMKLLSSCSIRMQTERISPENHQWRWKRDLSHMCRLWFAY